MFVRWRQLVLFPAIVVLTACAASSMAFAQEQPLTRQQERSALRFARQHHPELAVLLKQLDQEMTAEYDKAIRQIHVVNERLERIKSRSPEDHKLHLEAWKVDSRIKLLAARMTISSDERLPTEMEKLLSRKLSLKEQQLERDKQRIQARLEKIDTQLESLQQNREELLKRELARYRKLQPSKTTPTSTRNQNDNRNPRPGKPGSSKNKTTD